MMRMLVSALVDPMTGAIERLDASSNGIALSAFVHSGIPGY